MSGDRNDRELLADAENALRSISLRLIAVSPRLQEPYTDAPEHSPWSLTVGPEARRAHDLARDIRKYLGAPHHFAMRPIGTPALTSAEALRDAVAALYMAGIKTGAEYEQAAAGVIDEIYAPKKRAQAGDSP